jgi:tetratricopeptide (TPR) repeat protein
MRGTKLRCSEFNFGVTVDSQSARNFSVHSTEQAGGDKVNAEPENTLVECGAEEGAGSLVDAANHCIACGIYEEAEALLAAASGADHGRGIADFVIALGRVLVMLERGDNLELTLRAIEELQQEHGEIIDLAQNRELNGDLQLQRGKILMALSRHEEALLALDAARRLGLHAEADYELGLYYLAIEEATLAEQSLAKAQRSGIPADGEFHYRIGRAYFELGRFPAAKHHLLVAVQEGDPNPPLDAYFMLTVIAEHTQTAPKFLACAGMGQSA